MRFRSRADFPAVSSQVRHTLKLPQDRWLNESGRIVEAAETQHGLTFV
jgi:hypothetical protein